ncbi:MAG: response regulator [Microcoleaceae cyanobacterium]
MHPWLQRQLDQLNLTQQMLPSDPSAWQEFLEQVSRSYREAEQAAGLIEQDGREQASTARSPDLEVQQSLSLLQATFNATDAGILALDKAGEVCNFNRKFVDLWQIPESMLTHPQGQSVLAFVLRQLRYPPQFLKTVMRLSAEPQIPTYDIVEFRDSRTFEVSSHPSKIGEKLVGRVWSFRDVTERRRVERALQHRVDFEQLITSLSTHFISLSTDGIDQGIQEALEKISKFIGVSRGFLYLFADSSALDSIVSTNISARTCYEWLAPIKTSDLKLSEPTSEFSRNSATPQERLIRVIENRIQIMSNVLMPTTVPWIIQQLGQLQSICLPNSDIADAAHRDLLTLSQFHPSNHQSAYSQAHSSQDIRFLILIPLVCRQSLVGFLRFDATHSSYSWSSDNISLLKMVAEMFSNTLERQRTEEALRRTEAKYRSIFENAAEGICQTTPQGQYLSANPALARILGYQSPEDLMQTLSDISQQLYVKPNQRAEFIQKIQAEGAVSGFESQVYRKDGSLIWISENSRAVHDRTGQILCYEGTVEDITQSKQAAEALKQAKESAIAASRAKSTFLANMSHELRTPLNAIIGYSEILAEEVADLGYTDLVPDLERICSAGRDLLALINDILDISKIEAGRMDLYLETFSIPSLIELVISTAQPLVDRNGNTLTVEWDDQVSTMQADMTKVRQILLNLLSNAAKFTTAGQIHLKAEVCLLSLPQVETRDETVESIPQACIRFQVSDTGIGMSLDQQDLLFQPFTQGDASMTRRYGGTGLGLAISQRFCQMMGGCILAESQLGQGSTFTVILPQTVISRTSEEEASRILISSEHLETDISPDLPAFTDLLEANNSPSKTVLVIDDDPVSRDLVVRSLSQVGLQAIIATTGEEGLHYAQKYSPDVITLDIMMPSMDGWTVLSALKANPQLAEIPVIVLSFVGDRARGFALGASDYLSKPVDRKRLATLVSRHQRLRDYPQSDASPGEILIVEDHKDTSRLLRGILEQDGWQVVEAEDGQVALNYLKQKQLTQTQPRLILLDLILPQMSGCELIAELRQVPDWAKIPVIVTTAMDLTVSEQSQLRASVEQVLQKGSYSSSELLEEVHQLIRATLEPLSWVAPQINSEFKP